MGQEGDQKYPTKFSVLFTKKVAANSQRRSEVIFGSPQLERCSVSMGTENCELMYSKLCISV